MYDSLSASIQVDECELIAGIQLAKDCNYEMGYGTEFSCNFFEDEFEELQDIRKSQRDEL